MRLIGYFTTRSIINPAIIAGKIEKSIHIMFFTESIFSAAMVTTVCPSAFVPEIKPTAPSISATNAPEIAEPNFCDIVPDEKISPVDDVPFFSVA